jgi:protein-L-isoaspartate(D-aspartate) O-methyltransferase
MINRDLKGRGITDPRVLEAMVEIPREEFVSQAHKAHSYADRPLPIGMDQTISQPYIVALMTQELRLHRDCEVLEVGTGSGYQTAILSRLAKHVYTIEKFGQLADSAKQVLQRLGLSNIAFCIGDGSCGWPVSRLPPAGCFDRIMVTAAVPEIPPPLADQLAEGGFILAPIGAAALQQLVVGQKTAGKIAERTICSCRFVKLLGKYGFEQ